MFQAEKFAQELYNADTGELLCRAEAQYGTGDAVFDEGMFVPSAAEGVGSGRSGY